MKTHADLLQLNKEDRHAEQQCRKSVEDEKEHQIEKMSVIEGTSSSRKKDSHKQVMCNYCRKWMRSDHLKQHSKTHPYLWQLNEEERQAERLKRKMV